MRFRILLLAGVAAIIVSHGAAFTADGSSKQLRYLRGHTGWVSSVQFSPDGRWIISGDGEGMLILWNVRTATPVWTRRHNPNRDSRGLFRPLGNVIFSSDGRLIASSATDLVVRLWEAQSGRLIRTFTHERGISSLLLAQPSRRLVAVTRDDVVLFLEVTSGNSRSVMKLSMGEVLAVSNNGKFLATEENEGLRIWDIQRGAPVSKVPLLGGGGTQAAFSSDGRLLAAYSGRSFSGESALWDVRTRKVIRVLSREWAAHSFVFSPNGRLLAMMGRRFVAPPSEKSWVLVWDVITGDVRASLEVPRPDSKLAFAPDGRILAITDYSKIVLWMLEEGR